MNTKDSDASKVRDRQKPSPPSLRLRGKGKVVNLRRKPDRAFVNFNLGMQKKKERETERH